VQVPDSSHGVARRAVGGPVRRFVATHLGSRQVSRVIYGAIIGLALVVALEAHPPAAGVVIATLLGTAVAVALAELYSELVGFETGERRRASLSELRHLGADMAAVAFGIAFPAVFFVLAATGFLENEAAFTAAKWTGLGLIGPYGFAGARLSGAGVLVSVMQAVGVARCAADRAQGAGALTGPTARQRLRGVRAAPVLVRELLATRRSDTREAVRRVVDDMHE
jgi:hypothetical protein